MADSSLIENAVIAKLLADGTLMALVPDGVYFDEAAAGKTRFVIVSLVDEQDAPQFGGRSYEDTLLLVKAVMLSTAGGNIQAAAARIDVLLEGTTLTAAGYSLMMMARESRIRATEVDESDTAIRWQHRGGHYRVVMSL
jgi:hypothetical protein